MGGLGPQKFFTFGPSDSFRKKTIKFHLMRDIAFIHRVFVFQIMYGMNRLFHAWS